ncbi:3444_t:CDS:2 [Ambispora leptoticha]|uniref:3442_t:CDS:1 n=1 Tax=Ambispora leptoticha TaxID=144679 RepID=A0A9N8VBD3_9GLOM|nr:3442_t:CDS:2 [Ambispora leptoticha]CAG8444693.1 3444_t:CDS:2 [Ambispora leptoticha]
MTEKLARKAVEDLLRYRASLQRSRDSSSFYTASFNDIKIPLSNGAKIIDKESGKNTKLSPTKRGLKKIKIQVRNKQALGVMEQKKKENPLDKIRKEQEERKLNLSSNKKYFKTQKMETKEKELKKKILNLQKKKQIK